MLLFRGMPFEVKRVGGPDSFLRAELLKRQKNSVPKILPTTHASFIEVISPVVLD